MDHLLKIYSAIKPPSIDIHDLEGTNIRQFMNTSLPSAERINHDPELKSQATNALVHLLGTEHDTMSIINSMFESAAKTCLIDKERELIHWLQTCVSAVVQYRLEPDNNKKMTTAAPPSSKSRALAKKPPKKKVVSDDEAYVLSEEEDDDDEEAVVPTVKRTTRKKVTVEQEVVDLDVLPSSKKKTSPKKKKQESDDDYTDDSSDQDEHYEFLGHTSDDEEDDDDDEVPEKAPVKKTTTRKKASKKKEEGDDDQKVPVHRRKPLKEATLPVIEAGAGTRAIANYFLDFDKQDGHEQALSSGYFARSFFFPSKDSFNAFVSALNSAKKTIDICVFAFTDDEVVTTLTAAQERGVKIKIITDNQQAAGKGADVKNLYESHGIPFRTDKTNGYMHNKFAIIDSATLINGSFNWSKGARFKNKENIIITNIPLCIKEFQHEFDSLWDEFA